MISLKLIAVSRKVLLAGTLTCLAMPAVANVITDWDTKAVALVAPAPVGAAGVGHGPRRNVRRGELDRAALPTLPGSAHGAEDDLAGSLGSDRGRYRTRGAPSRGSRRG